MLRKYKYILLGLLTHVPGLHAALHRGTGGTNSARYCYSVWLRHMAIAAQNSTMPPHGTLAEIGPGDSLGIGVSALLCGFERYYAFDHVAHAASPTNLQIFDELVALFRARAPIPGDAEFPNAHPKLLDYAFPSAYLTEERLAAALAPERVARLRADLEQLQGAISYVAPWQDRVAQQGGELDFIVSQAAMEHVDRLEEAYATMATWLKPGGIMSHQIDYKCHEMSEVWNGHMGYSPFVWRLMRGRLPYLLNRRVHSQHVRIMQSLGLRILTELKVIRDGGLAREQLGGGLGPVEDDDFRISGALVQAQKP